MGELAKLVIRSASRHWRKYVFLIAVIALGYGFISFMSAATTGMERAVMNAALRHYAGHLFVMGRDKDASSMMVVDNPQSVEQAVGEVVGSQAEVIRRVHEFGDAWVFFQGASVRLKDLFGIDLEQERDRFAGLELASGELPRESLSGQIVLSQPVADQLRLRVGDRVTVRLENRNGQVDTRTLVVPAVLDHDSIYGYSRAYMDREQLASLMALGSASASVYGILLDQPRAAPELARALQLALQEQLPLSDQIATRDDLTAAFRADWEGVRYFVFPLSVYVGDVLDLVDGIASASWVVVGLILVVLLVTSLITSRVVLHDRQRELGTLLSVGFSRVSVVVILVLEAVAVAVPALLLGELVSLLGGSAANALPLESVPGLSLVLESGRLALVRSPGSVAVNIALALSVYLVTFTGFTAFYLSRSIPALLRGQTV